MWSNYSMKYYSIPKVCKFLVLLLSSFLWWLLLPLFCFFFLYVLSFCQKKIHNKSPLLICGPKNCYWLFDHQHSRMRLRVTTPSPTSQKRQSCHVKQRFPFEKRKERIWLYHSVVRVYKHSLTITPTKIQSCSNFVSWNIDQ